MKISSAYKFLLLLLFSLMAFIGCKKNGCTDPAAYNFDPNANKDDGSCFYGLDNSDATFTYQASTDNPNIVIFTADNPDVECSWDFGNGLNGSGKTDTAIYPYADTYNVTLSIFNSQGNAQSTQQVVIDSTDISLLDNPLHLVITGGLSGPGYRTWHVDSACATHMGVGPPGGSSPDWWSSGINEKPGCGLYDDRFTFYLIGYEYDMINNGDVYIHNSLASSFPGSFENLYDYTAPYTDQLNELWTLGEDSILTVSNNSFIGFYSGVNEYKVTNLTDTSLWLQYGHHSVLDDWSLIFLFFFHVLQIQ